ncbi:MAG: hypothetical protein JO112_00315 [Planctomycetes bacterium]|nr:hypothetical protein [Planctomycetota bacterium]
MASSRKDTPAVSLGLYQALIDLLQAYEYAREVHCRNWDFAVELDALRTVGFTASDLRWLVCKGYAEHAAEVNLGPARQRAFRRTGRLRFCRSTCVVLTEAGVAFAYAACASRGKRGRSRSPRFHKGADRIVRCKMPHWDSARRELRLGKMVIKEFKQPAPSQEMILNAFQEEGWPSHIDDPLPPPPDQDAKRHLHNTITNLNRHQKIPLLRFLGNGNGSGVRWEFQ